MNRQILNLFLLFTVSLSASAYDFWVDGIVYNKNSDGTSVTVTYTSFSSTSNYSGGSGSLIIPEKVTYDGKTYSVTSIGDYAFYECCNFTGSLEIPSSVTSIGEYAFFRCSGITGSLAIGNSVTSIGRSAFEQCSGFTGSLSIPNSVSSIGDYAFSGCSNFSGPLIIPNSVTSIGNGAFDECSGLTGSLTIPNSVNSIGNYAFAYCRGFTGSLTIPNSVTSIGNNAFYGCNSLTSVTIPNSVTKIGRYAFYKCIALNEVRVKCNYPITSSKDTFSTETYKNATLYIPKGTLDFYSRMDCWQEFANIVEDGGPGGNIEGDVNGDGKVDVSDVNRIIDIILGL